MDDTTFVRAVSDRLGCDERRAEDLIFAVFTHLRDRLTPEESADVAAQLPTGLRHLWQSGELPHRGVEKTHRLEFLGRVREQASLPDEATAERTVLAVFHALQRSLGSATGREGEARDVLTQLPADLKTLWLRAADPDAA